VIRYAILGLLSWKPLTGYDLKLIFQTSTLMYWSGNSNQIYRTLVKLHEDELVSRQIEDQESGPSRKIYTITEAGNAALRDWILSPPELPDIKHPFLIQVAWADALSADDLDEVLARYEQEVGLRLAMLREQLQRQTDAFPNRTPRETLLWQRVSENWIGKYDHDLTWVRALRTDLQTLSEGGNP
jgi:PadR family transcriptional regulator AphA